jgi:hypothetical protein
MLHYPHFVLVFFLLLQVLDTVGESTMGGILTGAAASLAPGYKVFTGSGSHAKGPASTTHISGVCSN